MKSLSCGGHLVDSKRLTVVDGRQVISILCCIQIHPLVHKIHMHTDTGKNLTVNSYLMSFSWSAEAFKAFVILKQISKRLNFWNLQSDVPNSETFSLQGQHTRYISVHNNILSSWQVTLCPLNLDYRWNCLSFYHWDYIGFVWMYGDPHDISTDARPQWFFCGAWSPFLLSSASLFPFIQVLLLPFIIQSAKIWEETPSWFIESNQVSMELVLLSLTHTGANHLSHSF